MTATSKEFTLTHIFKNVSSFKDKEHNFSCQEEHYGIPWRMSAKRNGEHLEVYLYCDYSDGNDNWFIRAIVEFKLISTTGNDLIKSAISKFYSKTVNRRWGLRNFCEWSEMETKYLSNGNLKVQMNVKILEMTGIKKQKRRNFDESMKRFSDVVLNVGIEKFYVLKLYLAYHSTYFEAMFLREFKESDQREINLPEVNPEDFQSFLELLYGESSIDGSTLEGILNLADKFGAKLAIEKCSKFLINESKKSLKQKLELAKRYQLNDLQDHCLSKINTPSEIQSFVSNEPNEMDPDVLHALLQKTWKLLL